MHNGRQQEQTLKFVCMDDIKNCQVWGGKPSTWRFQSESALMDFYAEAHQELIYLTENTLYDTITAESIFYQQFKSQNLPLDQFYKSYQPSKCGNFNNCIAAAIATKDRFVQKLPKKYSSLISQLFVVTTQRYPESILPESFANGPPNETGSFKTHVALALKFTLDDASGTREGFILFEAAYGISKPIVIMKDQLAPHTGSFWARGKGESKANHFKLHDNNYVRWETTKNGQPNTKMWYYLGKMLVNYSGIVKRNKVSNLHGYMRSDAMGLKSGFYSSMKHNDRIFFLTLDDNCNQLTVTPINVQYFVHNEEYDLQNEAILEKVSSQVGKDLDYIKIVLRDFSVMLLDKEFIEAAININKEFCDFLNKPFETKQSQL